MKENYLLLCKAKIIINFFIEQICFTANYNENNENNC